MTAATIEGFQLSPQQKYLWNLQRSQPQTYRIQVNVKITGNLDIDVLKAALQNIIQDYELFRTNFKCLPEMDIPMQVIQSESSILWLPEHDLSSQTFAEQQNTIKAIFTELLRIPFDFAQSNFLYASLIKLSTQKYILILGLPAILADTTTIRNLLAEISRYYTGCIAQEPLQYADIATWQNELLAETTTEIGREYWRNQKIVEGHKLPYTKESDKNLDFHPQCCRWEIDDALLAKINKQAQSEKASFLLACWQILLWHLTQENNIAIATAVDGRKYEELHSALGLLTQYLPIVSQLNETNTFSDVWQQVKDSLREIYKWQESFTWQGSTASNFLPFCFEFDSICTNFKTDHVSFAIDEIYTCSNRFHVKLSGIRRENSLVMEFHYDANLLSEQYILRLVSQFQTLLQSVLAQPQTLIGKLEILSAEEKHLLLVDFNQTQTDYPQDKCVHQLFAEQVQKTPNNIAVVFGEQQLTYAELNTRANQLAHHLQKLGVGAEVLVGLCCDRSFDMLIGILAILKAGGAYVPLDPTYPQERLSFMLQDSQVSVLLTQQKLLSRLPQYPTHTLCIDTEWPQSESQENPLSSVHPANLAYVIYTSGSTGKPKGTMIPHQGLVNYLSWSTQAYAVAQGSGAPVNSSIGFDATITSLFSPLLVGQKVVLLEEEQEIEALSTILSSQSNFSLVKITPAHLEILSQLLPQERTTQQTRALIIGGEALLGKTLAFWQTYAPDTRLINEYGPTETVVGCCVYEASAETYLPGAVPIGRPIANTQLYILNQHLQPVPIGVSGELYIGGAGVARGYLNRPELTAEKFISNLFSQEPGSRMYKTGDLARYLEDGTIEYLGRIDNQVKIRGFRVELGEIESLLSQYPNVRSQAVIVREDQPGDQRLVAYIVPDTEKPTPKDLRNFLQTQLPEYMIPSVFVILEALPLTTNGKVNRQALPAPEQIRTQIYVAPRTSAEEIVTGIWAEVLGITQVGIDDNFFDLGGHSLLATQVIARLRQIFQVELPLRGLFDAPTPEMMVHLIANMLGERAIVEEIAQTWQELAQLSPEEMAAMLSR
ncbi:amino acid adenylation domain-containing protein [Nostocaceae cyanobacterium CENA357]|uniref:Amino acid adenylation domain-containing protein n=1 Tax=Atlanticothrix silvestris CENA357 TaxID=1725252 RepID=A0A8J7HK32_9CYAN|nr:non-ribosomal peptide synthetase [Atlanticothrix silvestris]MBH8554250.1 amino acid adenylation domain-containing protein [Atlanticothrix silvestris CENA357]